MPPDYSDAEPDAFGEAVAAGEADAFGEAETAGEVDAFGEAETAGEVDVFGEAETAGEVDAFGEVETAGEVDAFGEVVVCSVAAGFTVEVGFAADFPPQAANESTSAITSTNNPNVFIFFMILSSF